MDQTNYLVQLIESNLEDIMSLHNTKSMNLDSAEDVYSSVLYYFLKNDLIAFNHFIEKIDLSKFDAVLRNLIQLRLEYRKLTLTDLFIEKCLSELPKQPSLYKAETFFIAALAYQKNKNYVNAKKYFELAAEGYEHFQAFKKSLRSWANAIAALSCEHPDSFLIPEYNLIYKKSRDLDEWPTCIGALINLSRELQRIGALAMSFKKIDEAEKIAEQHMYFSREHHLCLLQKAHLISCFKQTSELADLLAILKSSSFPDVQESAFVLESKIFNQPATLGTNTLPTWLERHAKTDEFDTKADTDSLDSLVVNYLTTGAKSKDELIQLIYGNKIDFLSLENRFKNLIYRVRQKFPGKIIFKNGKYELVDISYSRKNKI